MSVSPLPKEGCAQNCRQGSKWICKNICMVSSCKNAEKIFTSFCSQVHKSPFLPESWDPKHEKKECQQSRYPPWLWPLSSWELGQKRSTTYWSNNQHPRYLGVPTWSLESKAKDFTTMCEGVWLGLRYRCSLTSFALRRNFISIFF